MQMHEMAPLSFLQNAAFAIERNGKKPHNDAVRVYAC